MLYVIKKIFSKKLHKIFGVIEKLLTPLHKQINKHVTQTITYGAERLESDRGLYCLRGVLR
ncbi:hypothetical protein A4H97_02885 [Niastella yeongjuensis]|uniref:Uncharacterized protein n=1 Tax=Niastella yeongjuensis TaxID=354355 RepID=A0A1V9EY02_9BACT|nr:hypothetical protein A4H97_02885 [Niastella yeongjuensis]